MLISANVIRLTATEKELLQKLASASDRIDAWRRDWLTLVVVIFSALVMIQSWSASGWQFPTIRVSPDFQLGKALGSSLGGTIGILGMIFLCYHRPRRQQAIFQLRRWWRHSDAPLLYAKLVEMEKARSILLDTPVVSSVVRGMRTSKQLEDVIKHLRPTTTL